MRKKPTTEEPHAHPLLPRAPVAQRLSHTFSHHGITVEDPYAWLRDANYPDVEDQQILTYLRSENDYFDAFMAPYQQTLQTLFDEIKARQPAADESVPYLDNGYYYQWRFHKNAQYRTWYRAPAANPENWQVLLDETALAEAHSYFRLGAFAVSPDNRKLAYSMDVDGSERYQLNVINLEDRTPIGGAISNTIDTPIWNSDSNQLVYVLLNERWTC